MLRRYTTVVFTDLKACNIAISDWPKPTAGVVLISTSATCSSRDLDEARHYILVTGIEHDDRTVTVTGKFKRLESTEAVGAENPIDVKFGNFSSSGKNGINTNATPCPTITLPEGTLFLVVGTRWGFQFSTMTLMVD
jgi:hypothetical protein